MFALRPRMFSVWHFKKKNGIITLELRTKGNGVITGFPIMASASK